jgi:hypothetical protein
MPHAQMAVCAQVIAENIKNSGDLNPMIPGQKVGDLPSRGWFVLILSASLSKSSATSSYVHATMHAVHREE